MVVFGHPAVEGGVLSGSSHHRAVHPSRVPCGKGLGLMVGESPIRKDGDALGFLLEMRQDGVGDFVWKDVGMRIKDFHSRVGCRRAGTHRAQGQAR